MVNCDFRTTRWIEFLLGPIEEIANKAEKDGDPHWTKNDEKEVKVKGMSIVAKQPSWIGDVKTPLYPVLLWVVVIL